MANQFTWTPLYQELAKELVNWQSRQGDLITFLEGLRANDYVITPFMDRDENGERFPLTEIDPFTFFGVFNRGIKKEQRIAILAEMKKFFGLSSSLPVDFDGIPVLNNMSSWFISFRGKRKEDDTAKLWRVFLLALGESPLKSQQFLSAFDDALTVRRTNINLTIGLFWIRPDTFLNLDSTNRAYLGIPFKAGIFNANYYAEVTEKVRAQGMPFTQISFEAWEVGGQAEDVRAGGTPSLNVEDESVNYWLVGAYWDNRDPANQTARFLEEGIWENGYDNKYGDEVNSMKVGDKIAIKASATQRKGLPFDNKNITTSRMIIKAVGTIVANRKDGRTVEVEWDPNFQEKDWYFYTSRNTIWHVRPPGKNIWTEAANQLIDFVWYGKPQNYDWFTHQWWGSHTEVPNDDTNIQVEPYGVEDILASGVFLSEEEIKHILDRAYEKKALIIQGPPGVGKTFIAQKLAYALMKEKAPACLEMVQFHQSYSYDDFVRGYRPLAGQPGTFGLQNGVFYEFCQKAINDPEREYVFIIDEINRGNLSQIFGEMLMLIERDKRGSEYSVPLVYRDQPNERFYIPSNVYLIGLMNVADRSLAMVDYALRRRFAFVNLRPQYESDMFHKWLSNNMMNATLIQLIVERMSALNKVIREDPLLGENYQVGHSFFCPKG
ncbi:MAG TPA: AAA family ATPase, partial [Anaerolineales bacterium]|nr:AAA family ATPase [Anaerolineales bacterium]